MPQDPKQVRGYLLQLWQRFKGALVKDVPEDMAVCFDCRKDQCSQGEWDTCERRISKAAGELMPSPPPGKASAEE
jgi:hypothetical protein